MHSKALKLEASGMLQLGYLKQEDCPFGMYDLGMQFACEAEVRLWDRAIKHVYGHFHAFAGTAYKLDDSVSATDCQKYFHPPEASFSHFLVVVLSLRLSNFLAGTSILLMSTVSQHRGEQQS